MPGATEKTTRHRTAPRLLCAYIDERDVKTMVPKDVAMATCTTTLSPIPVYGSKNVKKGVRIIPPPMPSRPAKNPTKTPIARRQATRVTVIKSLETVQKQGPTHYTRGKFALLRTKMASGGFVNKNETTLGKIPRFRLSAPEDFSTL